MRSKTHEMEVMERVGFVAAITGRHLPLLPPVLPLPPSSARFFPTRGGELNLLPLQASAQSASREPLLHVNDRHHLETLRIVMINDAIAAFMNFAKIAFRQLVNAMAP